MVLAAVLVHSLLAVAVLLFAFGIPYFSFALLAALVAFLFLPRAEAVMQGCVSRSGESGQWLLKAIIVSFFGWWLLTTPEMQALIQRVTEERLLLDWRPLTLLALYVAQGIYRGVRAARTMSDETIYAYFAARTDKTN
jgi:hypothetical protein